MQAHVAIEFECEIKSLCREERCEGHRCGRGEPTGRAPSCTQTAEQRIKHAKQDGGGHAQDNHAEKDKGVAEGDTGGTVWNANRERTREDDETGEREKL